MARLLHSPALVHPNPPSADPMTDLTRLLTRLQQTVLHADAQRERRLRTSEFERKRVASNINHARTLLTRMEQAALTTKVHSRRQELLTDLNRKREVLDQLVERLSDLDEIARRDPSDDETSDEEDILAEIVATPSESMDSTDVASGDASQEKRVEAQEEEGNASAQWGWEPETQSAPTESQPEPSARTESAVLADKHRREQSPSLPEILETTTSQTIRSRSSRQPTAAEKDTALSTGTSATNPLFAGRRQSQSHPRATTTTTTTATAEAILDLQRAEQDALSESILRMASDLKASSRAFARSLEEDRDALSLASQGLDRTERGLEAAARAMGALRRVTEGKGWWGRMMLYAWIYGLMVVLVLVVFALPKLRF